MVKILIIFLIWTSVALPCCLQRQKQVVSAPIIFEPAQPLAVRITNINELIMAYNSLQAANMNASISFAITPEEVKRTATPEMTMQDSIVIIPTESIVPIIKKLEKSHALIESFYSYPPARQEKKD